MKKIMTLLACLVTTLMLFAQKNAKYEVGLNLSSFTYLGDLTPNAIGDLKTTTSGFGVYTQRIINSSFAVRLNLAMGKLKGNDADYNEPAWRQQRNLNFHTRVTEFSALGVWNLMALRSNEAGIINFTPYLLGGIGYSFSKVNRDWSHFNAAHFSGEPAVTNGLNEDIATSVPKGFLVLPVGLGVRYGFNQRLSFTAEGLYRHTFTDYIDGFSKAANPRFDDHFYSISIGILYSLGKKSAWDCPSVSGEW
jgi:hypothetical protein